MDKFVIKTNKQVEQPLQSYTDQTSSDADTTSEDGSLPEKAHNIKKAPTRKYCMDWERQFKWVRMDAETKNPICVLCKQLLIFQRNHLERHAGTTKHMSNGRNRNNLKISEFLPQKNTDFRRKVAIAEIKLVLRMASCNHSFKSMDNLSKFNESIYPDSKIAKSVTCNRTKSKEISQFLGKESLHMMVEKMKKQVFSLIIDETTDISTEKCLVLMVRQFDMSKGKTVDSFFRLVQPSDSSGESITNCVLASLEENQIPLNNFIGFASDNASTMVGKKNGVATLLKKKVPHLFHIGCVCHSINLVNSSSLSCITEDVEQLLRNVFKYFKSGKRQKDFKDLQSIFDVPEHKLLRLSDTGWLSFESVATRLLEQWSVLQHYFIRAQFEERCSFNLEKIRVIQDALAPVNKTYLNFIVYILKTMNKLNKTFQSESSQIIYLVSSTKDILLELFKNFIKKDYINKTQVEQIAFWNVSNLKDITDIYIGHEAELLCKEKFSRDIVIDIKSNILKFYQKLCQELISRIDIQNKKFNSLKYFDPLFIKSNKDINYFELVSEFKDFITDPDAVIIEFKLLESKVNDKSFEEIFKISNAEDFWREIGKLKNRFDENMFLNLYKLISYIFTLPHSSASAERCFSKLALVKNKLTNRLKVNTCESMLSSLNLLEGSIEDWTPSEQLIQKYRNRFKTVTRKS